MAVSSLANLLWWSGEAAKAVVTHFLAGQMVHLAIFSALNVCVIFWLPREHHLIPWVQKHGRVELRLLKMAQLPG